MQRAPDPSLEQQLATISTQLTTHVQQYDSDQLRLMARDRHQQRLQNIHGMRDMFQVCGQAASIARDRNIEAVANGLMAGTLIYEGYVALTAVTATTTVATAAATAASTSVASTIMSAMGPYALIGAGALTLYQLFSRKKRKGNDDTAMQMIFAAFQALSQQIANMHYELREFRQENYENQLLLLKTVCEGFKKFESAVHQDFLDFCLPVMTAVDRMASNQQQWDRIHASDHHELALQRYDNLLNRMLGRLEGSEAAARETEIDKLLGKACDWLKIDGNVSRPIYTGTQVFADRTPTLDLNQWVNEVALVKIDKRAVVDRRGFLAAYVDQVLGIPNPDVDKIFNPSRWIPMANCYLQLRHLSSDLQHDKRQINLDRIIEAVEVNLTQIRTAKRDLRRFNALVARYENEIKSTARLIDNALAKQNQIFQEQITRQYPKNNYVIDIIATDIEQVISLFNNESPLRALVKGGKPHSYWVFYHRWQMPLGWYLQEDTPAADTTYTNCGLIHKRQGFIAEFVLLEVLGLGQFEMEYKYNYRKPADMSHWAPVNYRYLRFMEKEITIKFAFAKEEFQNIVTVKQLIDADSNNKTIQTEHFAENIDNLRQRARITIGEFFANHRKIAMQSIFHHGDLLVCWQALTQALDAPVRLLLAMALDSGCKEPEVKLLKELWTSREVALHIHDYVENGLFATPLPSKALEPMLTRIKQSFLEKINSGPEYFDNPLEAQLEFLLNQFKLLKSTEQSAWRELEAQQFIVPAERIREIFENYEININIWSAEKYRKSISAIDRSSRMYQSLMKNISLVMALVDKISTDIESLSIDKILTVVRDLLYMNSLCSQINAALRHLSPADIYRFGPNDFGFLVTDHETLKQLEKELSKLHETPTTGRRFMLFTPTTVAAREEGVLPPSQPSTSPVP